MRRCQHCDRPIGIMGCDCAASRPSRELRFGGMGSNEKKVHLKGCYHTVKNGKDYFAEWALATEADARVPGKACQHCCPHLYVAKDQA